jgi:choline/glycine/proline betaine transport protein
VNPPVFFISGGLLVVFVAFSIFATETAGGLFTGVLDAIGVHLDWFYVLAVATFIGFAVWIGFGRFGDVRLGRDDDRPEYGTLTWFAMLFSAGMGIGLLFYGVAEPMMHFSNPPVGEGGTIEAARRAVPLTFFHWGIHAWTIYVVMGLGIAYFAFRKGLPLALRSTLYPLLGERIYGWWGHAVDILAVLGTLFGLATSLGLGAMQINAGMHHLFDAPIGVGVQLILIAVITAAATVSLVSGVDRGIRRLSELNMIVAGILLLFVFAVGPTDFLLDAFVDNLGNYARDFLPRTFFAASLRAEQWHRDWTLFYWGWWIAWAPFVGTFLARISRGRTIREFVTGVVLAPTLVTFVWMTVFGDTAIYLELFGGGGIAEAVRENVPTAIYVVLEHLPLSGITSFLAAAVVAIFFVTSSDSASFVVDMLTSGGHPNPPRWQRVFWAVTEGVVAAVLLYVGGKASLKALQSAVIAAGLPFSIVLLAVCVSLRRALKQERGEAARQPAGGREPDRANRSESLAEADAEEEEEEDDIVAEAEPAS